MPDVEERKNDKRKQSLYFPTAMLKEIKSAADEQGVSISNVLQRAWQISRSAIKQYPGVEQ